LDLLDLIKTSIEKLPDGPHLTGLRSVLRHIDAAYKHFERGQSAGDESAFTDAIYRTNQAFEGSIKEAYRVLTGKDPQKSKPYDIEKYLEEEKIFRDRVLFQFTNYRQQWRNPSTHDYNLDFDEDEAFLAIISVSAFTKLLVDQITEQLAFLATKDNLADRGAELRAEHLSTQFLIDRVACLFLEFARYYADNESSVPIESEAQLTGALTGFISSVAPEINPTTGRIARSTRPHYIDMIVEKDKEQVIVELKRGKHDGLIEQGLSQLLTYLSATKAKSALLFLYSADAIDYTIESRDDPALGIKVRIIRPKRK
jgi:hypothetical protein